MVTYKAKNRMCTGHVTKMKALQYFLNLSPQVHLLWSKVFMTCGTGMRIGMYMYILHTHSSVDIHV